MNIAVIGAGTWGKHLLKNLAASPCTITHIAYGGSEETERFLNAHYPHCTITKDYNEILIQPDVNAVFIATPIETHGNIARQALQAGKHVFVEKPLTASIETVHELYRLAEANDCCLFTGYLYLYDPAFHAMAKELHDASSITLAMVWEKYGTFDSPLHENLLVHDIALATELLGTLHLDHVTHNERDIFEATFSGERGHATITINRTILEKQKKLTIQSDGATFAYEFTNENLLALELTTFLEATKTGSVSNEKREPIDTAVARVLASLPIVT